MPEAVPQLLLLLPLLLLLSLLLLLLPEASTVAWRLGQCKWRI